MSFIKNFLKNEIVLVISFAAALISMIFVAPDSEYFSYIDFRTLSILLTLMLVMAGLQKLSVFRQIGEELVSKASNTRLLVQILVLLCFFFSMLITNDVALITFVPFSIVVLNLADNRDLLIRIIVLETIAANLGSMTTPIGNPQNLYLYSLSNMKAGDFFKLMGPFSALSLLMLIVATFLLIKNEDVSISKPTTYIRDKKSNCKILMYLVLFAVSLLVVVRVIDFYVALIVVVACVLIFDRNILLKADYSLLLTFVCLFIFIGNMKRMPIVAELLSGLVCNHEVIVAVITSQFISNVPAAILLSGFTDDIAGLIVGTNLGGLGTLIASMASLISFKQYGFIECADTKKYLASFTLLNLLFLCILLIFASIIL